MSWLWPESRPVRVHFDLDADQARQALREALQDERRGRGRRDWSFQGEVLQRRISVFARWGFGRAEAPLLTGTVVPAENGSDFVGAIGLQRSIRWLVVVAWAVLAVDLVALSYTLWVAVTGLGSVPDWFTRVIGSAVILPVAAALGLWRRRRIRRSATPPTATEALTQWLVSQANRTSLRD